MRPKTILGEVAEELRETVRQTGKEVRKQSGKVPAEVVGALTGGQASVQSLSELKKKDDQEKAKEIAYFQRVLRQEQEAAAQVKGGGRVDGAKEQKAALDAAATAEGTKEMKIVKPPGDLKRRLPWQKPVKGRVEMKDFSHSG